MTTDLAFFRATMPESSALATGADDALKDLDNTWFLRGQPEDVRRAWFGRIRILRLVDRLKEAERRDPSNFAFSDFAGTWRGIYRGRGLEVEMATVQRLWLSGDASTSKWNSWCFNVFLDGVDTCHEPIEWLDDHTATLGIVSGAMFNLFPFVPETHRCHIWHFGLVDGFWNNLRDLAEDSAAGLCYFPTDVLERHGLSRDDVLTGRCIGTVDWQAMMRFWLDEYMPTLLERAQPFVDATGLHPSLEALRGWCMHRWRRVESVFRDVGYDYRAFSVLYWQRVRLELAERSEAA